MRRKLYYAEQLKLIKQQFPGFKVVFLSKYFLREEELCPCGCKYLIRVMDEGVKVIDHCPDCYLDGFQVQLSIPFDLS